MLIRKIVMEKMLAEDIPPINGDRIQLQQVFLNLILNAADALVEVEKEPRKITVMTQYKDNKEVWISISDTGPGLDDAVKDRLFDPFYTTKSEGMGVGLAICSTIVKLHGGGIQTESRRGGGATFHVVLLNAQEEESPCPD
jgi:signal transduction histidine kinase